jgi:hypothetical protein
MHTSLEILEIKLVFYLLFCCTIYNIRERVVSDIRTSSGRRELVYLIQHGREYLHRTEYRSRYWL